MSQKDRSKEKEEKKEEKKEGRIIRNKSLIY
jgi:hypothetical protein